MANHIGAEAKRKISNIDPVFNGNFYILCIMDFFVCLLLFCINSVTGGEGSLEPLPAPLTIGSVSVEGWAHFMPQSTEGKQGQGSYRWDGAEGTGWRLNLETGDRADVGRGEPRAPSGLCKRKDCRSSVKKGRL